MCVSLAQPYCNCRAGLGAPWERFGGEGAPWLKLVQQHAAAMSISLMARKGSAISGITVRMCNAQV